MRVRNTVKQGKVTDEDLKLDLPTSWREILRDELEAANFDSWQLGKPIRPVTEEMVDALLQKVCEKIEREALKVFKSNELWALKAWAYSNILKDTVAAEANQSMVEELMSPVLEWQQGQDFDPVAHIRKEVEKERKSDYSQYAYMGTITQLVSVCGRKRYYTDGDVGLFIGHLSQKYPHPNTYAQECRKLRRVLRMLPTQDGKHQRDPWREFPMKLPPLPDGDDCYQPTLSLDEMEKIALACLLENIPRQVVVRFAVSEIYAAREDELAKLSSEDFELNEDKSYIYIKTGKKGQRRKQPIPQSLVPIFSPPIEPMARHALERAFKRTCKLAGVELQPRSGWHSIRRGVATELDELVIDGAVSGEAVDDFFRWKRPTMRRRYSQRRPEEKGDWKVLEVHPMADFWDRLVSCLDMNPEYGSRLHNWQYRTGSASACSKANQTSSLLGTG